MLFDNLADPYQMRNLAEEADYNMLKEELKQKMWKKMNEIGDSFENNSYYEKNWVMDQKIVRIATLK